MAAVSISLRALEAGSLPSPAASSRRFRSLFFMFCAASLVKVMTRNCEIEASGCLISVCLIFSTMTVVLPEPAAAETRIFWFRASIASLWESLNSGIWFSLLRPRTEDYCSKDPYRLTASSTVMAPVPA